MADFSNQPILFEPTARHQTEFAVQTNSNSVNPTLEAGGEWTEIYSLFNRRHFGNVLPNCMITFTRRSGVLGHFCAESFRDLSGAAAHEIALNPCWFNPHDDVAVYRTMMHEMIHLWRHVYGRSNRKGGRGAHGYHDVVWAEKMIEIGLMPSSTGLPGGRRTGFGMGDYMIEGSPFDLTCRELVISGRRINWRDGMKRQASAPPASGKDDASPDAPEPRPKNTRTRFVCSGCDLRAWARASARLSCDACHSPLITR